MMLIVVVKVKVVLLMMFAMLSKGMVVVIGAVTIGPFHSHVYRSYLWQKRCTICLSNQLIDQFSFKVIPQK